MTADAADRFDSGNGLVEIDIKKATMGDTTFIDHNNVMSAVKRKGTLTDKKNAERAKEVLFKGEIPYDAITLL